MKGKMETSKQITWVFIAFYIFILLAATILSVFNHDIKFVLDYVHQIIIIIVISYFSKSGIENIQKIRINPQFNSEKDVEGSEE